MDDAGSSGVDRVSGRGQAIRAFAWSATSFGANKLLVFVSTLVLTRLLAPSEFGVAAAALAVIAYLEILLDLGLSSAVIYQQDTGHTKRVHVAFTINATICALLAVLNYMIAPVIASLLRLPDQVDVFRVLSIYVLFRGLGALADGLLKRDLRFRQKAAADLVRAVVRGGLAVALAFAGFGVWALIWGLLAAEAGGVTVSLLLTRYRPRLVLDRAAAMELLRFGTPVAFLNLLTQLSLNSDYLVVGRVLGPEALGFYTIAYRLPELLLSNVYWIFSSVAFPVFSRARKSGLDAFRHSMLQALRLITLFAFPVSVGLALVSRDAVRVLFSEKWAVAASPMVLISLAIGVASIGYASGDIYKAAGRPGTLLAINTVGTGAMLVGYAIAAPHGITAVAAVHVVLGVMYMLVRVGLANRFVSAGVADVLEAMRPALLVAGGIVLLALPVRLLTSPGALALLAICAAGGVGAALGFLLVGGQTRRELALMASEIQLRRRQRGAVVERPQPA